MSEPEPPDCPYYDDGYCIVAGEIAGRRVVIQDLRACQVCQADPRPMQPNGVTSSLAISTATTREEMQRLARVQRDHVRKEYKHGVGDELSRILHDKGWRPEEGCKCSEHAAEMNSKGIEWCENNIRTIKGWLKEEAARRGYTTILVSIGGGWLIRESIKLAKYWKMQQFSDHLHQINETSED